jgi:hypothetical protein
LLLAAAKIAYTTIWDYLLVVVVAAVAAIVAATNTHLQGNISKAISDV